MNLVAGAVAVLLLSSPGIAPAGAVPDNDQRLPTIEMSIVNWGEDVDLAGSVAAYAHLGADGPTTRIKVNITPPSSGMHGYVGRLTAPDAYGGELKLYCGNEYMRVDSVQRCFFDVPMTSGINRITFDVQSASFRGIVTEEGKVTGGRLGQVSVLEAALPYRNWAYVPPDEVLALHGEQTSSLRYRIMNTGELPFRVPDSCQPDGTVWPYQQLLCPVRGERPVYALAGDYAIPIELEDPVGGGASFTIDGHLRVKGIDSILPSRMFIGRTLGSNG